MAIEILDEELYCHDCKRAANTECVEMDHRREIVNKAKNARQWTKGLPQADGDYYSRIDEYDRSPTPIRIEHGKVYEFGCAADVRREHEAEEWEYLGPTTTADAEQLVSLRAAAEAALEAFRYMRDVDPGHWHYHVTPEVCTAWDKLRAALSPQTLKTK